MKRVLAAFLIAVALLAAPTAALAGPTDCNQTTAQAAERDGYRVITLVNTDGASFVANSNDAFFVIGSPGDDFIDLSKTTRNSIVCGKRGSDTIIGGKGDDTLRGGRGADTINGGHGDDFMRGGPGDDTLVGEQGNDSAWGGEGSDSCDAEQEANCEH